MGNTTAKGIISPTQTRLFKQLPSRFSAKNLVEFGRRFRMRGLEVENALRAYQRAGLIKGNAISGYQKIERDWRPPRHRRGRYTWATP